MAQPPSHTGAPDIFTLHADSLAGVPVDLARYRGQVLLIVNTASQCGFTKQYSGLESLYQKFQARGVTVLGFPCNQFGAQEPGTAAEIGTFCERNFGVSFPLFARVDVNGAGAHPLFVALKRQRRGLFGLQRIHWNFTKFLVGRDGAVLKRYAPTTTPAAIEAEIERLLAQAPTP